MPDYTLASASIKRIAHGQRSEELGIAHDVLLELFHTLLIHFLDVAEAIVQEEQQTLWRKQ